MPFKPQKKVSQGAPEWVLTYGDMMSLLLTFFILLAALSELKKEDKYNAVAMGFKQGMGASGGGGVPSPHVQEPKISLVKLLDTMERRSRHKEISKADDPGQEGKQTKVQRIREGEYRTDGGRILFDPASAELNGESIRALDQIAKLVQGHTNKIEVRGHAWLGDLEGRQSPYQDLIDLSHARAKAAAAELVRQGVQASRLRIIACGTSEPVARRVYGELENQGNRRVEVIVTDILTGEMNEPETDSF